MDRRTLARSAGTMLISALAAALAAGPVPVAGNGPLPPPAAAPLARPADLAPALSPDGTFRGAPGAVGTVDTSAWALVSDLAAGEAPRFAPAARRVAPAAAGPWAGLGSNGAGDGALTDNVWALAASGSDLYAGGTFSNAAGIPRADHIARWNGSDWFALGSNGAGDGALDNRVQALAVSGGDLFVGGSFTDALGLPRADYVARWGLGTFCRPDARIRRGSGAFVGNGIYNTTGAGQRRSGSAARGHTIGFGISIQNDGTRADRFKLKATGAAASGYGVKYFRGATDITAAVVAGTYRTPSLAPGATYLIGARVTVKPNAAVGSKVTRLATITSVLDSARKDAVKLIGKRA